VWHKTFMSKTLAPHKTSSPPVTECIQSSFTFGRHFRRQVSARFDGGVISSDSGALLLREVDQRINLLPRLAACFEDGRDSRRASPHGADDRLHPVRSLAALDAGCGMSCSGPYVAHSDIPGGIASRFSMCVIRRGHSRPVRLACRSGRDRQDHKLIDHRAAAEPPTPVAFPTSAAPGTAPTPLPSRWFGTQTASC